MTTSPISVQTNTSNVNNLNNQAQTITIPANGLGNFLMVTYLKIELYDIL